MADDANPIDVPAAQPIPICAIGASAGGVVALQALFRRLPCDLNLAYVVILHLAPDQPSALCEILTMCTKMPVFQVQDRSVLKPNSLYVIAPDRELVIEGDNVSSRAFSEPRGQRLPIDLFFHSIAAARGDGVAVVLSGTGSDGAQGIRAVKDAGGVIMVQHPVEAEFAAMPQNAIATGMADFIVPIAEMAERLEEVARSKDAVRSLDADAAANELRRIIGFLRDRTGHDFSSYKRATVMRRVTRRMQVCRLNSLVSYADLLQQTPEEAKELFSDLLISVTSFFRDSRAFDALKRQVIDCIMDDDRVASTEEGVRAWVVGCATGEEAYSLAMLLLEAAHERNLQIPIQIFATDLDEGALATAREGRYPRSIEVNVSAERLARFFVDEGTHFRVRKDLRDSVIFAVHSVLKEPPFLRLDLVSCRNLLIYLERSLQQQLYTLFHYGLKSGRFLFLGSAETADTSTELFAPLDREARIYATRPRGVPNLPLLPQYPTPERLTHQRPTGPSAFDGPHVVVAQHAGALEQAGPPSALVDAGGNLLNLSPSAGRFILHSAGPPSNQLPAIVRPELRLDLKLALAGALDSRRTTLTHPVVVSFDNERRRVSMHVAPVISHAPTIRQAVISFLDGGVTDAEDDLALGEEFRPEEVPRLHAELKAAQEALVASRSSHDATIQDLRATNEELQSTNEEYRSTAEELETSREELQSINEELHTVNAELKGKLENLSVAHSDLQNLTAVMEIGTLFLDAELRIKMFTLPIVDVFPITKNDIGRAITDFAARLDYPALVEETRQVLQNLAPLEREVRSTSGRFYVMRMRPYRTVEDRIEGVVQTFVDITARLKMEQALVRSEQQFRALVRASSQVLFRMSADWTEMRELLGGGFLSTQRTPLTSWLDHYIPAEDHERVQTMIQHAIESKTIFDLEHRVVRQDSSIGWTHSRAIPILNDEGDVLEWFGSADDVTSKHRTQGALRESEDRLRVLVEGMPQHIWRAEPGGLWTWSSPQWHRYTGLSEVESRGSGWMAAIHPDDRPVVTSAWTAATRSRPFEVECRIRNMDEPDYRWFRGQATPQLDVSERVTEWLGTFTDVDDLRMMQGRQEVLLGELQSRVSSIMAMIRLSAERMAENNATVSDYAERMNKRLEALTRIQVILMRRTGAGVNLETLVRNELTAQHAPVAQVTLTGPAVSLSAKVAEVLALAVHELAANALEHGALTSADGTIRIEWDVAEDENGNVSRLAFRWQEFGVTIGPEGTARQGFGTELITQRLPHELGGTGQLDLLPDGAQATFSFPLHVVGDAPSVVDGSGRAPIGVLP